MLSTAYITESTPPHALGHRRGISDLARFAIDLIGVTQTVGPETSALCRAYPSPPMSGSPPLPPKAGQEASDRSRAPIGSSTTTPHDVRFGVPLHPAQRDPRVSLPGPSPSPRPFAPEQPSSVGYPYRRPDEILPRVPVGLQQHSHGLPPGSQAFSHGIAPHPYPPLGASSSTAPYATAGPQSVIEAQPFTSPRSQRKTKGHVASACVPCKKAHLRCDAQRPCSRCMTNGKEDACVDVQHKKRGRPRLRDDRDTRFDPSRIPNPPDLTLRRPLSIHPSGVSERNSGYEEPLRRIHSNRVLKSQPRDPRAPRFIERASASDANIHAAPLHPSVRLAEPIAYLTASMEFAKVSPTFMEALGGANAMGRKLTEICVPGETEKVLGIQNQLIGEQRRREPNYLPPILGRGDQIIQGLGFSSEELARFQPQHQEYLTFIGADGHARPYPLRIGLAKEGSFYFVVMVLSLPPRYAYPSPSPHPRDVPSPYRAQPSPAQPPPGLVQFAHTPVSATFDPVRHRLNDPVPPRPGSAMTASPVTPSGPSGVYSASPIRSDFSGPSSYQPARNEYPPVTRVAPQPTFQLPPIRATPESRGGLGEQGRGGNVRSSRVNIGGLIDQTEEESRQR